MAEERNKNSNHNDRNSRYGRNDRSDRNDRDNRYNRDDRGNDRRDRGGFKPKRVYFRKKVCKIETQNLDVDYKKPEILQRFITDQGKILPRRITGTCAKHQRLLVREIKKARILALLPWG